MSVSDEAVEAAVRVTPCLWRPARAGHPTHRLCSDCRDQVRAALEAAAPHMQNREQIQVEVLTHARSVITQWLSTAEEWRYDQVCADFQEMIDAAAAGELVRPA